VSEFNEFLTMASGMKLINAELDRCISPVLLVGSQRGIQQLEGYGLEFGSNVEVIDEVSSHPTLEEVLKTISRLPRFQTFEVIAIGGGSVIDFAKGLILEFAKIGSKCQKFQAVPTTAGSGSECTTFATFWDGATKQSLDDESLLPSNAIYIPELLRSQTAKQFVAATSDAVAHCLDTLWNKNATSESKGYAEAALELLIPVVEYLPNEPTNAPPSLLQAAQHGAALAGQAINISRTSISHALSYPLTTRLDIPHGLATGLTLRSILTLVLASEIAEEMRSRLQKQIGIAAKVTESTLGFLESESVNISKAVPNLVRDTLGYSRLSNFVLEVTESELEKVLEDSFFIP
jgi:alcohol dehydrogenase class IV